MLDETKTDLGGASGYCGNKSKHIDQDLFASGKPGGRSVKKSRWKVREVKTDLNRPNKETGLRSSATGLASFTSMAVGSPLVEVMEGQSCFSDCFGLTKETGLFGEGEGFSCSSGDMLGMEEGRRDGRDPSTNCQVFLSRRVEDWAVWAAYAMKICLCE